MLRIEDITEEQALAYLMARLSLTQPPKRGGHKGEYILSCPLGHSDSNPSFGFNTEKKTFKCHSCGEGGGLLEFEMELMGVSKERALENIGELIGQPILAGSGRKGEPSHVYDYTDEDGRLLFQVVRFDTPSGKRILQRQPGTTDAWDYRVADVRRVLYRLPDVIRASHVIITEGEKDAELVRKLEWHAVAGAEFMSLAVTTNPGGAGKWREEYSPYLTGKQVYIFRDNDAPGEKHAQQVAQSVARWARVVKVITPPMHDVGDWIAAGAGVEELAKLVNQTAAWLPPQAEQGFFVDADSFLRAVPDKPEWFVEGLLEKGASGILIAIPKGGKSWLALDLALHMAQGRDWFGHKVEAPIRVGFISREDNPSRTAWRLRSLKGELNLADVKERFWFNTRRQRARLVVDDEEQLSELITNCKVRAIEFLFLDVFNKLHSAEENDNTAIRKVLDRIERIQNEVGCGICVLHHTTKLDDPESPVVMAARGASAIAGFAEFAGRIDLLGRECVGCGKEYSVGYNKRFCSECRQEIRTIRRLRWESKAGEESEPMYYTIQDGGQQVELKRLAEYEPKPQAKRRVAIVGR